MQGLYLLKNKSENTSLITLLEKGENSFNRKKLQKELEALSDKPKTKQPVPVKQIPIPGSAEVKTKYIPSEKLRDSLPADVRAIDELRESTFKEMAALHSQLLIIKSVSKRYEVQLKIISLDEINDECWFNLNYYTKHKRLPESINETPLKTIGDVVNAAKNIPTYLTKINKKLQGKTTQEETIRLTEKKVNLTLQLQKVTTLLSKEI